MRLDQRLISASQLLILNSELFILKNYYSLCVWKVPSQALEACSVHSSPVYDLIYKSSDKWQDMYKRTYMCIKYGTAALVSYQAKKQLFVSKGSIYKDLQWLSVFLSLFNPP